MELAPSDAARNRNEPPALRAAPAAAGGAADVATLTLDEHGSIRDCCGVAERLFDYRRDELIARHVCDLLPDLPRANLTRDGHINPSLAFSSRCVQFDAIRRDGGRFACWLFFHNRNAETLPLRILVRAVGASA